MVNELGRIEPVELREAWQHEARDLTPWLLANADVLADALEIDLEIEHAEHRVGSFALDLLGRDLTHSVPLIVENQLEATDHDHLGKLITYAAGTEAGTIVWVAPRFRDEHRRALDWLNEVSAEDVRFFGVELSVVRIGDSPYAPLLRLAAEPNDWQKRTAAVSRAAQVSGKRAAYLSFWEVYLETHSDRHPDWKRPKKAGPENWLSMSSPFRGCRYVPGFAVGDRLRHELYIDTGKPEANAAIFRTFYDQSAALEASFQGQLSFEELPDKKASRIAVYLEDADVLREEEWPDYIDWLIDVGERMRRAFDELEVKPA